MTRLAAVCVFLLAGSIAGCIPPQTPAEKLTDSAYDVVMAARFGRMDLVTAMVRPDLREAYAEAHAEWGGRIRILDIEYGGIRPIPGDRAMVAMTVQWQRLDESILRTTAVAQTWERGEPGWQIVEEQIAAGDKDLLREPLPVPEESEQSQAAAFNAKLAAD